MTGGRKTPLGMGRPLAGAALLALLVAGPWVLAQGPARVTANPPRPPANLEEGCQSAEQVASLGVTVTSIRLSAGGDMLDLRYRVEDPSRARSILGKDAKPYLLEESRGTKCVVPEFEYIGAMRQTAVLPEKGKTYFILVTNPGRDVARGDRVTLVVGGERIEHLIVY